MSPTDPANEPNPLMPERRHGQDFQSSVNKFGHAVSVKFQEISFTPLPLRRQEKSGFPCGLAIGRRNLRNAYRHHKSSGFEGSNSNRWALYFPLTSNETPIHPELLPNLWPNGMKPNWTALWRRITMPWTVGTASTNLLWFPAPTDPASVEPRFANYSIRIHSEQPVLSTSCPG